MAPFGLNGDDVAICETMMKEAGVTAIPVSAFYQSDAPKSFVRFCFSKRDAVLDGALDRLARWVDRRGRGAAMRHPNSRPLISVQKRPMLWHMLVRECEREWEWPKRVT